MIGRPERPATTQEKYRLKQRRLAGAIRSGKNVQLVVELQLRRLNAAEVFDTEI